MKVKACPKCGSTELHDCWVAGRKLQQACAECSWRGRVRTPEIQPINNRKEMPANFGGGFHYEVFDRYGHIMMSSHSCSTEPEAVQELKEELKKGKTDKVAGPYIGIVWPAKVTVKGKIFK